MPFPKSQIRAPQEPRSLLFRFPNGAAVTITPLRISISGGHCRLYNYNPEFNSGRVLVREVTTATKFRPGFSAMGLYAAIECSFYTNRDGAIDTTENGSTVWIHLTRRAATFFLDVDQALEAAWPDEYRARQARFDAAIF
ncbi:MAG: hypothetical protein WCJ64_00550 [Rhodospirillaceae bacterium]